MDLFAGLLGGVTVLLPIFATEVLHVGEAGFGALRSASAVGAVAAVRIGWDAARKRRLNLFATVMLVVFGIGLVLSLLSGRRRACSAASRAVPGPDRPRSARSCRG